MNWQSLLQKKDEFRVLPWISGKTLNSSSRTWRIKGKLPDDPGWYQFKIDSRTATVVTVADPDTDVFKERIYGYLIGNRLVPDQVSIELNPADIIRKTELVYLIDDSTDLFTRVVAGRVFENGPLIFDSISLPLGPESEVETAFIEKLTSLDHIKGVTPALDALFKMECWRRDEQERIRLELEKQRIIEKERLEKERAYQQLVKNLGNSVAYRELAKTDFKQAAELALKVSGATLRLARPALHQNEMVVQFRFLNQNYECVCDKYSLRIIDAGICLTDHYTGVKGDDWYTLESLPSVIREAIKNEELVITRYVR